MVNDGWTGWEGKKVYLEVNIPPYHYTAKVLNVDTNFLPVVWITIIDKYGFKVRLSSATILSIKEDEI